MKTKFIGYKYLLKLMVFITVVSACNKKEEAKKEKKAPPLNIEEVMNFDKGGDGTYFRSISFADEMHGVVVGIGSSYAGVTMSFRTTDGGNTWQTIDLPADLLPFGNFAFGQYTVHFEKPDMGFLCGYTGNNTQGYIAKSTDKGKTWVKKTQYVSSAPWQLDFDGDIGIAVGPSSLMVRSTDGGETWTTLTNLPSPAENLERIHMHDPDNYYVSSKIALWRSQDKGLTWQAMALPPTINGEIIFYGNYQMDSKPTGYVHSAPGISKTTDAGLTWNYVLKKSSNPYFYGNVFVLEKDVICFRNNETKEFWISKNGGITFDKFALPKNPNEEIDIYLYDFWHEFAVNGNYMYCWPANSVSGKTQCLYRIKYK
jgi:photosystem II stability/assembly factor-like uncharacterized protein